MECKFSGNKSASNDTPTQSRNYQVVSVFLTQLYGRMVDDVAHKGTNWMDQVAE